MVVEGKGVMGVEGRRGEARRGEILHINLIVE